MRVKWNQTDTQGFTLSATTRINAFRFADHQFIVSDSEDNLQR
jgi:hypothetical protein